MTIDPQFFRSIMRAFNRASILLGGLGMALSLTPQSSLSHHLENPTHPPDHSFDPAACSYCGEPSENSQLSNNGNEDNFQSNDSSQINTIDLTLLGVQAPTIDIGSNNVKAGSLQYTLSGGSSDQFSVGTSSSISAQASASSTTDFNVNSSARLGVESSKFQQSVGNHSNAEAARLASESAEADVSSEYKQEGDGYYILKNDYWEETTEQEYNSARQSSYDAAYETYYNEIKSTLTREGTISGSFTNTDSEDESNKDITIMGIGSDNSITAAEDSGFNADIEKATMASQGTTTSETNGNNGGQITSVKRNSAGTASGSASGNISSSSSGNSSSSEFVNGFIQAY